MRFILTTVSLLLVCTVGAQTAPLGNNSKDDIYFKKILNSLTILKYKVDSSTATNSSEKQTLSKEELQEMSRRVDLSIVYAGGLDSLFETKKNKISAPYLYTLNKDLQALDKINRVYQLTTRERESLGYVLNDLQAKKQFADNNQLTPFGTVDITVITKNLKNQESGGYEVNYCLEGDKNDVSEHFSFDKFSSPTTQAGMSPGFYYFWTRNRSTNRESGKQRKDAGKSANTYTFDVSTDE